MIERVSQDNSGKTLIQEITQPPTTEQVVTETQPKVKRDINHKKDFKTQETHSNYFFIFNVPDYKKENAQVAFFDQEVIRLMCFYNDFRFYSVTQTKRENIKLG